MIHKTRGATMVEVVVAFTVLVLMMAIFSQAVVLTARTAAGTSRTLHTHRDLIGEYYRDKISWNNSASTMMTFENGNGSESFDIPVTFRSYKNEGMQIYSVIYDK